MKALANRKIVKLGIIILLVYSLSIFIIINKVRHNIALKNISITIYLYLHAFKNKPSDQDFLVISQLRKRALKFWSNHNKNILKTDPKISLFLSENEYSILGSILPKYFFEYPQVNIHRLIIAWNS